MRIRGAHAFLICRQRGVVPARICARDFVGRLVYLLAISKNPKKVREVFINFLRELSLNEQL